MNFELITSKENKLIKTVRKLLTSAKERKQSGTFVLEGLRLSADAARNGYAIDTVIVSETLQMTDLVNEICALAKTKVKVPEGLFNYICDTVSPQGILCVVKIPETVLGFNNIPDGKYIVLENTADPSNLGAIARTAEALGISGIITSSVGCDPFSPKSQRAGMGALLRLPIYLSNNVVDDMLTLKQKGYKVFASVVSGADLDVKNADFSGKVAVMIGNEANGLSQQAKEISNSKITINMPGKAESLNAAAAAAIIMWEMLRNV